MLLLYAYKNRSQYLFHRGKGSRRNIFDFLFPVSNIRLMAVPEGRNPVDKKNLNGFFSEHYKAFFRLAFFYVFNKEDAEDVLQDAFIKIYAKRDQFRQESSLMTWCYRIIRNQAIDFLRKKRIEKVLDPLLHVFRAPESVQPEVMAEKERVNREIEKALNRLRPRQKEVLVLKHFQNLSIGEISEITGLSQANVKVSLFRAARRMKNLLQGCNLS